MMFGAMLEPSYHLPVSDRLFVFLGIGFGLRYAEDPGVDFALRPKLGVDILVGRSGILKPAVLPRHRHERRPHPGRLRGQLHRDVVIVSPSRGAQRQVSRTKRGKYRSRSVSRAFGSSVLLA